MTEKRVELKVENQRLAGTLCGPEGKGPFPAVLVLHGRASNRQNKIRLIRELAIKGIVGLAFDFRGCGESEGEFAKSSVENRLKDASVAFEFLVSQERIDKKRLGLFGSSMGGYLAALVSLKREVKSLVLRAPASYKGKTEESGIKNSESIVAIRKFNGSLLIIQGERDEVIPERTIRAYYENAKMAKEKSLYIFKGAPHELSDPVWREELEKITCAWFKKTLK